MADQDTTLLQQQQELLRQIRDELRVDRTQTGGTSTHGGGGNAAYSQFRTASDNLVAGQWAGGAWSGAYRSQINQSMGGEALGALGFSRSPGTMTQLEYEQMSAQMLGIRVASMPAAVLSPSYNSTAKGITEDLYAFSPRFARFGDTMSGPQGVGMSFGAARQIGRDLSVAAAGDLRLTGRDYGNIMQTGLASGQFDQVKNVEELTTKFTQLKDTIADLTRVTRMTTSEMSSFMGGLRQAGVADIGDQRRITENLASSARVAGVAMADMVPGALQAITGGLGAGISAGTSAGLYGSNLAAARTMSRSGLVSQNLMAQAGGANGYAAAVTQAQQGFLGSTPSMLAMIGGGSSYLGGLTTGLGAIGGDLDATLALQLGSSDLLDGLDPNAGQAAVDRYIDQQASMVGGGAVRRQAVARKFYLDKTGNAAVANMAARRYSAAGQFSAASQSIRAAGAGASMDAASDYDAYYMNASSAGAWHRGLADLRGGYTGVLAGIEASLDPGQTGFLGFDSAAKNQRNALGMGLAVDSLSLNGMAAALRDPRAPAKAGADLTYHTASNPWFSIAGGVLGGAGLGGLAMAAAAAPFTGGLSLVAGGLGFAAGSTLGAYGGALGGGWFAPSGAATQISADQYNTLNAIQKTTATGASQAGRETLQRLASDTRFQNLATGYSGRQLSRNESLSAAGEVSAIAAQYGMSASSVAAALAAGGSGLSVTGAFKNYGGIASDAATSAVLSGISSSANVQTSEGAGALASYISAFSSGDTGAKLLARGGLLDSANMTTKDLARLDANLGGLSADERRGYGTHYSEASAAGASRAVDHSLSGLYNYLDGSLTGGAREKLHGMAGDKRQLFNALGAGGVLENAVAGDRNIEQLQALLKVDTATDRAGYAKLFGMSLDQYEKAVGKGMGQDANAAKAAFLQGLGAMEKSPDGILSKAVNTQVRTAQILDELIKRLNIGEAK